MARSFNNLKTFSALIANGVSSSITRRAYSAATQGVASNATRGASVAGKVPQKASEKSTEKVSWVPDPVTGYYKPENAQEIDVAALRAALLNKKN